jgi:putative transposase
MPKRSKTFPDARVFHVMNRAVDGQLLFADAKDARMFLCTLHQARQRIHVGVHAYCLMPNHFHLLVTTPDEDAHTLPAFMRWVTSVHAQRLRKMHNTVGRGALYHSRYLAVPINDERGFYQVACYVERNPVRGHLVQRPERWGWSSACADPSLHIGTDEWPVPRPAHWRDLLNQVEPQADLDDIRTRVAHNEPIGGKVITLAMGRTEPPGR